MQTMILKFSDDMSFKKGEYMLLKFRESGNGYAWEIRKVKCPLCYDKGYHSVMSGIIGFPDFIGDKGFREDPTIKKRFCTCRLGKKLKAE